MQLFPMTNTRDIVEALKQKNLPLAMEAVEHNWKNSFNLFEF